MLWPSSFYNKFFHYKIYPFIIVNILQDFKVYVISGGNSHQVKAAPVELVINIWLDIVHTLKGQWNGILGDFDAKIGCIDHMLCKQR